jgi:hypothetical protein
MIMLTLEAKITSSKQHSALKQINKFHSKVKHTIWRDLYIKKGALNEVKKNAISNHNISGRHFNSIRSELDGKFKALEAGKQFQIEDKEGAIKATSKTIKKLDKSINDGRSAIKAIETFKNKVELWRLENSNKRQSKKKPKKRPKL